MTTPTDGHDGLSLAELLGAGEQLLAAVTIAMNSDGEYAMNIVDVDGAPMTMSPDQKANALRMLATAVEAEAIFHGSIDPTTPAPVAAPSAMPVGYGVLVKTAQTTEVHLDETDRSCSRPFTSADAALSWAAAHIDAADVTAVAITPVPPIEEPGHE